MRPSCAAFFVLITSIGCMAQTQAREWLVIGVVGRWTVNGTGAHVTFGMQLGPQTSVSRSGSAEKTFGSITLLVDGARVTYSCDDPQSLPDHSNLGCVNPIQLASAKEMAARAGEDDSWLEKLRKMIAGDPDRYYTTVSRDFGALQDAVVAKDGQSIDLRPAFGSLNKSEYRVSMQRLDPRNAPVAIIPEPAVLHWDPAKSSTLKLSELALGLYQMHVETIDGESVGYAWVLIVSPEDFPGKSAAFAKVIQTTSGWGSNVPASGIRAVNRAGLDQLSR